MNIEVIEAPCAAGNPGSGVDPSTCSDNPPNTPPGNPPPTSTDERCADPAFYAANPTICAGYPKLLLKPEFSIMESGGTVQYRTFLRTNSDEEEILQGLDYSSSDIGVAIIEAKHGLATAVVAGIATISVKWQHLSAHSQFEVVGSCGQVGNNFLLLIDNSRSSSAAFSGSFATRLTFAKEAAIKFAQTVNYMKDKVAVAFFNDGGAISIPLSNNKDNVVNAIQSITTTNAYTNLSAGLKLGMTHLNTAPSDGRVLVLFSDGETNRGDDPMTLSEPWKAGGGLIMVVALRAWGAFFDKLYRVASTGYFLSAYEDTEDKVITELQGLKSFFCSGSCTPEPGTFPKAELNYRDFINWTVFQGSVDLIGLDRWDVLPGNGLYVDLAGTRDVAAGVTTASPGGLESKVAFNLIQNHQYRIRIDVAGNNTKANLNPPVRVRITSTDGLTQFTDDTITPTGPDQPFIRSEFLFIAQASKPAKIKIEMIPVPVPTEGAKNVGPIIDDFSLRDMTGNTVLLEDDFNEEHQVTVPPSAYNYLNFGCLDAPPDTQKADPTPPPLIEV